MLVVSLSIAYRVSQIKAHKDLSDPTRGRPQPKANLSGPPINGILWESYRPSFNMLNAGVDVSAGRFESFQEGQTSNCTTADCYYLSYSFDIVDATGTSHDVECEWDVDVATRTATPRNAQARYYWAHR